MSVESSVTFDRQLLDHIKFDENDAAIAMLNEDLAKAHDDFGTLLHYSVRWDNAVIARYLLEHGSEVDAVGERGGTPLMLAVYQNNEDIVRMLLEAGANVDVADDFDRSALEMAFKRSHVYISIIELFLRKVQAGASSVDELVGKLISAGCIPHQAARLKDVRVLQRMFDHPEFGVNCKYNERESVLHVALRLRDFDMTSWLVERGAEIDSLNWTGRTALNSAASDGDTETVQFLLERGADPNAEDQYDRPTPLIAAVGNSCEPSKRFTECVELLFEYGAVPQNARDDCYTIFDRALGNDHFEAIDVLVGGLAVLERRGACKAELVMICNDDERHREAIGRVQKDFEACLKSLDIVIFGTLTLFDLLTVTEYKMRMYVRNEEFKAEIVKACCDLKLSELNPYYCRRLMKRMDQASRVVRLEDEAIPVICDLFKGNYNQCYDFARKVIGYLNERELERLVLV